MCNILKCDSLLSDMYKIKTEMFLLKSKWKMWKFKYFKRGDFFRTVLYSNVVSFTTSNNKCILLFYGVIN